MRYAAEMAVRRGERVDELGLFVDLATGNVERALDRLESATINTLSIDSFVGGVTFEGLQQLRQNSFSDPILDRPDFVEARSRLRYAGF